MKMLRDQIVNENYAPNQCKATDSNHPRIHCRDCIICSKQKLYDAEESVHDRLPQFMISFSFSRSHDLVIPVLASTSWKTIEFQGHGVL